MTAKGNDVFCLPEQLAAGDQEYVVGSYYLELPSTADVLARAAGFAVGQSIGTWVEVPGVTAEMRDRHVGRVIGVLPCPPVDLATQQPDVSGYVVQVAVPTVNIGPSIPMLLTTILGNDSSTSVQAKLIDVQVPPRFAAAIGGPRFGVEGIRDLLGVPDRPLLLNMIKPCTGLTPEAGAEIFYQTALGAVDMIKDDELMGSPEFSPVPDRVKAYTAAAERARQVTGRDVVYIPNVTDRPDRMLEHATAAVDNGARALMVAFASVGYGAVQALAEVADVPILGHFAGVAPFYEGPASGMASPIAAGLLPRVAGADFVLMATPYGGYPLARLQYLRTAQQISLPRPGVKSAMPIVGGGVHPGVVATYIDDLGTDIVLGAGGAIQGHPDGPAAGADAMRQAIDAAMAGVPVTEAAGDHRELAAALRAFA
ncbi:RuBisCO large subunit C-terminal-like domain-containing protein [Branchiibius cervicis]|uniref:RuBisCO large subunit C-terminal-like domain-containing protein n=1 Tax=Branchiibius cervicis TaxID=908252 RepID=A0ABW2AT52_9MICO